MNRSSLGRELNCWPERSKPSSPWQEGRKRLVFIRNRFPHRSEIISVLGIAVFVCHSWTILGFLNRLSSFILYLTTAEIAEVFAFMMAFALLESLLITAVLAVLSAILPSKWFRDGFAYKGFIFMVVMTLAAIIFQKNLKAVFPPPTTLALYGALPLLLAAVLIGAIYRMPRVQRILLSIADRFSIMLFLYVPIGVLSMVVVLGNLL